MTKRSKLSAAIASVIAVTAVVVVATAMAKSGARTHHASPPAVSPRLYRIFSVLRSDKQAGHRASAADSIPPLPAAVVEGMAHEPGLDTSAAVFAGGTYPAWVVPGTNEVCLIHGAIGPRGVPGGVCSSIGAVEQRGLAVTTESATGAAVVLGLVPNGNSSVNVTNANGSTESVPVANNVYEITSGTPSTIGLREASGAATTRHVAQLSTPPPSSPGN